MTDTRISRGSESVNCKLRAENHRPVGTEFVNAGGVSAMLALANQVGGQFAHGRAF